MRRSREFPEIGPWTQSGQCDADHIRAFMRRALAARLGLSVLDVDAVRCERTTGVVVAARLRVRPSTVTRWATGSCTPSAPHARKLEEIYAVPAEFWSVTTCNRRSP